MIEKIANINTVNISWYIYMWPINLVSLKDRTKTLDNIHKKGINFSGCHGMSCLGRE